MTEAEQRARVLEVARTWLNTPYHHEARVKGGGVDCAMLLAEVYEEAGLIPHVDPPHYPPDWFLHRSEEKYLGEVTKHAQELPKGTKPGPGDLITFKFGRCTAHGAIVTEWPYAIHSLKPVGVILDQFDTPYWSERLSSVWTLWPKAEG